MNAIQRTDKNQTARNLTRACVGSCRKLVAQLAKAKKAILAEFTETLAAHESMLRLALNEAEALAWQTAYPHLVFPALAMEKAQALAAWDARQRVLRRVAE